MSTRMQTIKTTDAFDILDFHYAVTMDTSALVYEYVWFHGKSGIGKTSVYKAWAKNVAKRMGLIFFEVQYNPDTEQSNRIPEGADPDDYFGYIDLRAILMDVLDCKGAPWLDVEEMMTVFLRPGILPDPKRHGTHGFLLFDELAQAFQSVSNALSQLILDHKIGDSYLFPYQTWTMGATGNRKEDNAATQRAGAHIYNRFSHYELEPDHEALSQWLRQNGGDDRVAAFCRAFPDAIHAYNKGDIVFPTPRQYEQVSHDVARMTRMNMPRKRQQMIVAGHIGVSHAVELMTFLEVCDQLASYDDIVNNPTMAPVPDVGEAAGTSALYAVQNVILRNVTEPDMDAVMVYVQRMPEIFQSAFVQDLKALSESDKPQHAQYKHLLETVAITKWRADHPLVAV